MESESSYYLHSLELYSACIYVALHCSSFAHGKLAVFGHPLIAGFLPSAKVPRSDHHRGKTAAAPVLYATQQASSLDIDTMMATTTTASSTAASDDSDYFGIYMSLAVAGGLFMAVAQLPQIHKVVSSKGTQDVSYVYQVQSIP